MWSASFRLRDGGIKFMRVDRRHSHAAVDQAAGWRRLRTEKSAISRRESSCRGPSQAGQWRSLKPPKRRTRLQRRQPRTHPLEPARPFRGCRGDNLILHLRIAQLWSAAACCRFLAGQLAGRNLAPIPSHCERLAHRLPSPQRTASKLAGGKRQQAAALQSSAEEFAPTSQGRSSSR